MKLLARILSHGFAIAIVLLLAVGLIYRGELFPEYNLPDILDIGKLAEQKEKAATGQAGREIAEPEISTPPEASRGAPSPTTGTVGKGPADENRESPGSITAMDAAAPAPEPDVDLQEPATEEVPQRSPGAESEAPPAMMEETGAPEEAAGGTPVVSDSGENGQQQGNEPPETTAPLMDESEPAVVPEEDMTGSEGQAATMLTESATPEFPEAAPPVPAVKKQEKAYALLAAAREAYWLRDYEVAETKYQALTRMEPDNPDGYGELGNMYFSQGQWDEAASAYYEAGLRLIGQGLLDQAEELAAVIRGLNGGHADDLEGKIKAARNAAD